MAQRTEQGSPDALCHRRRRSNRFAPENCIAPKPDHSMPTVEKELNKKGDFLVDYEEKVFPDIKADPGEKALVTFHTVAFEGSISIVNTLTATPFQRKGSDPSILFYSPPVPLLFH